jgi:3-hydroxyanthranilate 3,4-dioxygenase
LGSTKYFIYELSKRNDDYIFYSLECNSDKAREAQELYNYTDSNKIKILNEVIWNKEPVDFMTESFFFLDKNEIKNFYITLQNQDPLKIIKTTSTAKTILYEMSRGIKELELENKKDLIYQIEGDIIVRVQENGQAKDVIIKEGEMFLLPANTPHSPARGENTVGLVIERVRKGTDLQDGLMWFCEKCNEKLYEEYFELTDIVKQLPPVMEKFYSSETNRVCNHCGTEMQAPVKK